MRKRVYLFILTAIQSELIHETESNDDSGYDAVDIVAR